MSVRVLSSPSDVLLSVVLVGCQVLSIPLAMLRRALLWRRQPLLVWLSARPGGVGPSLRRIAFAQLARFVFKICLLTGMEGVVLRRVRCYGTDGLPSGGCVLALDHSPWGRVLARWAAAEQFALVFAHRRWARWAGPAHLAAAPSGIRRTTAELVRGRRVAVIIDDFVARGGCEVDFLDHRTRVAMRATWLAAQARVPVVPVTICYRSGVICVHFRPALSPGQTRGARAQTTRELIDALAGRIERRPAEWQDLFAFFDASVPRTTSVRRYADLGAP